MNILVYDVGGTAIKYALMNDAAEILEQGEKPTPPANTGTFEDFLAVVESIYHMYEDQIDGLAFSMPGRIDIENGIIVTPGALEYNEGRHFYDELKAFTDLPVIMANDGKCAALAEYRMGALQGCDSGAVVVIGTGIGGGFIIDHKLWNGHNQFAGELSFPMEQPFGVWLGNAWGTNGATRPMTDAVAVRKGLERGSVNGKDVFRMIEEGDEEAYAELKKMCDYLGYIIFNIQCIVDPERVAIGGGISRQPLVRELIQKELDRLFGSVPCAMPHTELVTCKFFNDANLIGALCNWSDHYA